jgi:hypothetical protein
MTRMSDQTRLSVWVEGLPLYDQHDCRFDIFWTKDGLVPPCKRKVGDPGWEPGP